MRDAKKTTRIWRLVNGEEQMEFTDVGAMEEAIGGMVLCNYLTHFETRDLPNEIIEVRCL